MCEALRVMLSLTLSGALLTALAAGLNRLLRRRVPRVFLYYLWALVALRFLCPLGTAASLTHQVVTQPTVLLVLEGPQELSPDETPPGSASSAVPEGALDARLLPLGLTLLWALGAAGSLGSRLVGLHGLSRRLKEQALPIQPWEKNLYQYLAGEGGPRLVRSAAADTPMVLGVLRPTIYLPDLALSEKELRLALDHELVHWRRGDLLYRWVLMAAACVHWFNPAAWYLLRAAQLDCELACDEAVVQTLSQEERRDYGAMLLQSASRQYAGTASLLAPLFGKKQRLKERLCSIMNPNRNSRTAKCLLAGAVLAITLTSAILGAYAVWSDPQEAEPWGKKAGWKGAVTPVDSSPGVEEQEALSLAWPFAETDEIQLTALFDRRIHPITGETAAHGGLDILLPQDTEVLAAAAGRVLEAEFNAIDGNYVILSHGGGWTTKYCHLAENSSVQSGQEVAAGARIGAVGTTGASTGYHLHLELAKEGSLKDALDYLPQGQAYVLVGGELVPLDQ